MKTESVTVGMGATIPHPLAAYANLKVDVRYTIRLEDDDGPDAADNFLKNTLRHMVDECRKRDADRRQAVQMSCDLTNFERDKETDIPF